MRYHIFRTEDLFSFDKHPVLFCASWEFGSFATCMEEGFGSLRGRGHSDLLSHKCETNYSTFRSSRWTAFKTSLKGTAPGFSYFCATNETTSLLQSALIKKPVSKTIIQQCALDNNITK